MNASTVPPPEFSQNLITGYGAELLATLFAMALWGISCMQSFLYFLTYKHDHLLLKLLVLWLLLGDTIHQFLIVKGVFTPLVIEWGDVQKLPQVKIEFIIQVIFTGLVALPAQCFFIYRVWILSNRNYILPSLLVPLALAQTGVGLVYVVKAFKVTSTLGLLALNRCAYVVESMQAIVDVTIAGSLIYFLLRDKSAFRDTQAIHMIVRLVAFTVNTALLTAVFAVVTILTLTLMPHNLIYAAIYYLLCPLYCNSVLASLNARKFIRSGTNTRQSSLAACSTDVGFRQRDTTRNHNFNLEHDQPPICGSGSDSKASATGTDPSEPIELPFRSLTLDSV